MLKPVGGLGEVGGDLHREASNSSPGSSRGRSRSRRGRGEAVTRVPELSQCSRAATVVRRAELGQAGGGSAADGRRTGQVGAEGNIQPALDRHAGPVHQLDPLGQAVGPTSRVAVQHHGRVVAD